MTALEVPHGIYLNAASHGWPSTSTYQAMIDHLATERERGPVASTGVGVDTIRSNAAELIGAEKEDLGFAFTTFGAWSALVGKLDLMGRRVLVAPHEWGDNVRHLEAEAARHGFKMEILPALDPVSPDLRTWADRLDERVAAIFVPMITSVQGIRYPVEAIAALPRPAGCRLVLDAAQALGQTNVDVRRLGCDVLVGTCRKWLRGPRGTAIFWRHPTRMQDVPLSDIEPLDDNISARLGMDHAIRDAQQRTIHRIEADLGVLRGHAMRRAAASGLSYYGEVVPQTGSVCISIPSRHATEIKSRLDTAEIVVKWPDYTRSEPNAPVAPGDVVPLRLSPHVDNTIGQIDAVFDLISPLID